MGKSVSDGGYGAQAAETLKWTQDQLKNELYPNYIKPEADRWIANRKAMDPIRAGMLKGIYNPEAGGTAAPAGAGGAAAGATGGAQAATNQTYITPKDAEKLGFNQYDLGPSAPGTPQAKDTWTNAKTGQTFKSVGDGWTPPNSDWVKGAAPASTTGTGTTTAPQNPVSGTGTLGSGAAAATTTTTPARPAAFTTPKPTTGSLDSQGHFVNQITRLREWETAKAANEASQRAYDTAHPAGGGTGTAAGTGGAGAAGGTGGTGGTTTPAADVFDPGSVGLGDTIAAPVQQQGANWQDVGKDYTFDPTKITNLGDTMAAASQQQGDNWKDVGGKYDQIMSAANMLGIGRGEASTKAAAARSLAKRGISNSGLSATQEQAIGNRANEQRVMATAQTYKDRLAVEQSARDEANSNAWKTTTWDSEQANQAKKDAWDAWLAGTNTQDRRSAAELTARNENNANAWKQTGWEDQQAQQKKKDFWDQAQWLYTDGQYQISPMSAQAPGANLAGQYAQLGSQTAQQNAQGTNNLVNLGMLGGSMLAGGGLGGLFGGGMSAKDAQTAIRWAG